METERLILDRIRETDRQDYFDNISHDKKVLETFICKYAETPEEVDLASYTTNESLFAVRLKETGRLIGIILSFDEKDGACEIGYGIGSGYWNRGYVTEAVSRFLEYLFDEKGFRSVCASFFTGNETSCRVMEKCGMHFDRLSEKELEYLGEWRDLVYYEISREQWEARKKPEFARPVLSYITLRERPELEDTAAEWFQSKWGVPKEAYLECMDDYLAGRTEYGWYLCLDKEKIVGGMGVIENDFHDRKDLAPNVCAVYTEEEYRGRGIAGRLLNMTVDDMRSKGISPLYLVTDHIDFYERYGWEFLCMVQGDGEPDMTRMYIHR